MTIYSPDFDQIAWCEYCDDATLSARCDFCRERICAECTRCAECDQHAEPCP